MSQKSDEPYGVPPPSNLNATFGNAVMNITAEDGVMAITLTAKNEFGDLTIRFAVESRDKADELMCGVNMVAEAAFGPRRVGE